MIDQDYFIEHEKYVRFADCIRGLPDDITWEEFEAIALERYNSWIYAIEHPPVMPMWKAGDILVKGNEEIQIIDIIQTETGFYYLFQYTNNIGVFLDTEEWEDNHLETWQIKE